MSIQTLCRCGNHLCDNVIPNSSLCLLFLDERFALLKPSAEDVNLSHSKKPRSKTRKKAIAQRQVWFTMNALEAFLCPDCGRLHIFWQEELGRTSYALNLEKPHNEAMDQLGAGRHRLLPDINYDPVADAFRNLRSQTVESEAEAREWLLFQDCWLKSSCPFWFRENAQQVIILWEEGWITEYLYEYGEPPLLF